jgi:hypothetical protein
MSQLGNEESATNALRVSKEIGRSGSFAATDTSA